jgi:hypothetical protein
VGNDEPEAGPSAFKVDVSDPGAVEDMVDALELQAGPVACWSTMLANATGSNAT